MEKALLLIFITGLIFSPDTNAQEKDPVFGIPGRLLVK